MGYFALLLSVNILSYAMVPMTTLKTTSLRNDTDLLHRLSGLANVIRLLAFLMATLLLVTGVALSLYPYLTLIGGAAILTYALLGQVTANAFKQRSQHGDKAHRCVMVIDALVIGCGAALLQFALVPTLTLIIIVHVNAMIHGGFRLWLLNMLAFLAGAAGIALLLDVPIMTLQAEPTLLVVISLLSLSVFLGAMAVFANTQTRYLKHTYAALVLEQQQSVALSKKMAKYLPPQMWGSLFSGKRDAKLETRRKRLTVFFSDIKDFSAISEQLPLPLLTELLNTYLTEMTRIAMRHGGTIDKFIGDAIMIFFGDPHSHGSQEDAQRCVAMALEMQHQMAVLRHRWQRQGIKQPIHIRIGINSGHVTVGNFGTDTRMDYTILGTDVNLASRLESACPPDNILISTNTYELVKPRIQCRNAGEVRVKGFERPIPTYVVQFVKAESGAKQRYISATGNGFNVHLDTKRMHRSDKPLLLEQLRLLAAALKNGKTMQVDMDVEGIYVVADSVQIEQREQIAEWLEKISTNIEMRNLHVD